MMRKSGEGNMQTMTMTATMAVTYGGLSRPWAGLLQSLPGTKRRAVQSGADVI